MAAVSPAVTRETAPRPPTNRPEEAGLDRLKPRGGSMPCETQEAPLGQEWRAMTAAGIEMAGASC